MKRSMFLALLAMLPLSLALPGTALSERHGERGMMMGEQAAPAKEPELETQDDVVKEIKALRERVAALEALKPVFTTFMPSFAERLHVTHRAGDTGDWAVAAHEVEEMQRETQAAKYIDSKLGALMVAFMGGNLGNLREAIEKGNAKAFQAALKDTTASCNACHTATGSAITVSLDVDRSLNMRHPHALKKTTVPREHQD